MQADTDPNTLPLPTEMEPHETDTDRVRRKKEHMRRAFRDIYTRVITQPSADAMIKALAPHIKRNFFVSLRQTDGYFEFDHPGSAAAMSKLHTLGVLTTDSDQFYVTGSGRGVGPNHPDRPRFEAEIREKLGDQFAMPDTIYATEIQYSYVEAMVPIALLKRIKLAAIPELTSIIRVVGDTQEIRLTRNGAKVNTETQVSNTRHIAVQRKAPPVAIYTHGRLKPGALVGYRGWLMDDMERVPARHRVEINNNYETLVVTDLDYRAQKKDPNRAIHTLLKLLK
jgi:hypothetical protein